MQMEQLGQYRVTLLAEEDSGAKKKDKE